MGRAGNFAREGTVSATPTAAVPGSRSSRRIRAAIPRGPELYTSAGSAPELLSPATPMPGMFMPASGATVMPASAPKVIVIAMVLACTTDMLTPTVTNTASSNVKTVLATTEPSWAHADLETRHLQDNIGTVPFRREVMLSKPKCVCGAFHLQVSAMFMALRATEAIRPTHRRCRRLHPSQNHLRPDPSGL